MSSHERGGESSYDQIAHLYDVDMARNMAFDDVAFYASVVRDTSGPVLELGCGNGRILLALFAQGIDIWGVDRSYAMLQSLRGKTSQREPLSRVCQMDVRALGLRAATFGAVLCPYSLVTYMTSPDDVARMLNEIRGVLRSGGILAIDAFVPRTTVYSDEFRLDYSRTFDHGRVTRSKRVQRLAPGVNRIHRRYDIDAGDRTPPQRIETIEDIRPVAPDALIDHVRAAGFVDLQTTWDYGATTQPAAAQFVTVVARAPAS